MAKLPATAALPTVTELPTTATLDSAAALPSTATLRRAPLLPATSGPRSCSVDIALLPCSLAHIIARCPAR